MRDVACRFGCGARVYRFTDDIGIEHQLDATPLDTPIDHPPVRHRVWRYRSRWIGWVLVPYLGKEVMPRRPPGPLRAEHDCEQTPKHRRPCTCGDLSVHLAHTKPEPIHTTEARTLHDNRGSF